MIRKTFVVGIVAALAMTGTTAVVASASTNATTAKHHKKHKKHHKKPKSKSSFTGCSGILTGTNTTLDPPGFPYIVRFTCKTGTFSSFKASLNRTISSLGSASNGWTCSLASGAISCTSTSGKPFSFSANDPLGLPIDVNAYSPQTPCGSPALSGQVTITGDSTPIQLTPQINDC